MLITLWGGFTEDSTVLPQSRSRIRAVAIETMAMTLMEK